MFFFVLPVLLSKFFFSFLSCLIGFWEELELLVGVADDILL